MSATAQIDDDQLVSQPDHGTIFLSRRSELRLTKTPRYPIRGASGQQVGETPGEVVPFREGRFFCPAEGAVTLENGREVDAGEIKAWLERHRLLGDVEEGFWVVETKAPPVSREELERIAQAATEWDTDTLEAILAQESSGWGREDILQVARGAIERIRAMEERVRQEAAVEVDERVQEAQQQVEALRQQLAEQGEQGPASPAVQPAPKAKAKPKPPARG